MKEKIKNLSNKKIVITSLSLFVLVLLLGLTFAFWTRTFNQTGENVSTYNCFDLTFSENVNGISLSNGYPISDEEGLKSESYEVTITNTCKTAASYNVILNKLNTSTLDDSHVKVAVNSNVKLLSETETTVTTITNATEGRIINSGVLAGKANKTIKLQNWMDADTPEENGANKTFSYKISIESTATKERLLAKEILKSKIQTQTPDFLYGEPPLRYQEKNITNVRVNPGMLNSNLHRPVGTNYTFNEKTGLYNLTDIQMQEYDDSSIGKYTCMNYTGIDCDAIYKIKTVEGLTSNGTIMYMYVNTADKYTSEVKQMTDENSGLYIAKDDEGDSYYYRGLVNNNYVFFANQLWRVVRINGDSSIRLILDEASGKSKFSSLSASDPKYTGYTYDNDHICTKANPCTGNSGTNSTIKVYLDTWYQENLLNYDNYISTSNYCNDTSLSVSSRLDEKSPTLKCADTSNNYGGLYKLKIGLLSVDEMNMAGLGWEEVVNRQNYLYKNYMWWSMTSMDTTNILTGDSGINNYSINASNKNESLNVRPVINLKANVIISSGDGSEENPYVID